MDKAGKWILGGFLIFGTALGAYLLIKKDVERDCPQLPPGTLCPTMVRSAECSDGKQFALSGCEATLECAGIKCANHGGFEQWIL